MKEDPITEEGLIFREKTKQVLRRTLLGGLFLTALLPLYGIVASPKQEIPANPASKLEEVVSPEQAQNPAFPSGWEQLEQGLSLGRFVPKKKSFLGDSQISVLKIDLDHYSLHLFSRSQYGGKERTAEDWADEFGLVAAINAGMFEGDGLTSTGYMQNFTHLNNPHTRGDFNAFFAFNPKDKTVPPAQIIDRRCQDSKALMKKYNTLVQSIRMVDCRQGNTWSQQPRSWSTAALGMDKKSNVLFIHSRSPYTTHDFIDALLELPLGLVRAMYLEGGPEASLYVHLGKREIRLIGSYETGFNEKDDNQIFWELPNVIGIKKR